MNKPNPEIVKKLLAATAPGREVLRDRGETVPPAGMSAADVASHREAADALLAKTPAGRAILAERKAKQ